MNQVKKVIVTACGGDIGYNICRILKQFDTPVQLIGLDVRQWHAGLGICDVSRRVPPATESHYLDTVMSVCREFDPDLIIPISEPEIRFFNQMKLRKIGDAHLLYASEQIVNLGLDKKLTNDFLLEQGLPAPKTVMALDYDEIDFPVVMKPLSGYGSKFIKVLTSKKELLLLNVKLSEFILQEYLEDDNEEYTCGLFRSRKGEVRTLIFRRKLAGGMTGEGEVIADTAIEKLLIRMAESSHLVGSVNVQLRVKNGIPFVFEVNPRFSSTVYFRHLMGFRDVCWSIQDLYGHELEKYRPPLRGTRFFRVSSEVII